jgi:glycine cleavage system H protein
MGRQMATTPQDLLYTADHLWVRKGSPVTLGVTDWAQGQLGDMVHVTRPDVGDRVGEGLNLFTAEAVRRAYDFSAPFDGVVAEVNESLEGDPELINSDPYGEGWVARIKPSSTRYADSLISAADYDASCEGVDWSGWGWV